MSLSEAYVDFIAGWASGAAAVMLCQPVDTVLTRLQAGQSLVVGSMQTRGIVADYGMSALWRGSSAMISAVPFQNSLLMGGYGLGKKWSTMNDTNNEIENNNRLYYSIFVGGCTGGLAQSFLMSPVELMKVNQQVIGKSAKVAGQEVLRGLTTKKSWRGLNATLWRDGIPHGIWFVSYEWCKTELASRLKGTTGEQVIVPMTSGAFAATVAWVSTSHILLLLLTRRLRFVHKTENILLLLFGFLPCMQHLYIQQAIGYPFDTIKTRIQATDVTKQHGNNNNAIKGIYATGQELVKEANGRVIAGLYRGFGLKLVRAIPASMIGFTTYELVANQLR